MIFLLEDAGLDPITTFRDLGLSMGAVAICVSLFIWNTLEIRGLKDAFKKEKEDRTQAIALITKISGDQTKVSEQLAVIAANLVNLTSSVNQVVRELILVVRDVEK